MKRSSYRHPQVKAGWKYADDILAGKIVSCRWVRLACQRAISDHDRQGTPEFPYKFDQKKAARICEFISLLPHIKGPLGGTRIILEPWQCFALSQLFGWVHDRGSLEGKRRFRKAYLEVGRGNGKSLLLAAIGLYMLTMTKDMGVEAYSSAVSRDQAKLSFELAQQMCRISPDMVEELGIRVKEHEILVPHTASKYLATSSEANNLDGMNVSYSGVDELAQHPTRKVYDTLETGCLKRPEPLLLSITTAGSDISGIGYEIHEYVSDILNGTVDDPAFFGMIYTIDNDDSWQDKSVWIKANPNLGISVDANSLAGDAKKAETVPAAQAAFKTKHLDVWVSTDAPFFNLDAWFKCIDPKLKLEQFRGQRAIIGLDLASKKDLTAKVLVFPKMEGGRMHYYVFAKHYLPAAAITDGRNPKYQGFEAGGYLTRTGGDITDFEAIEKDILQDCRDYQVSHVAFDPHNAAYLVTRLMNEGVNMIEFRPTVLNFSEPMKELDAVSLDHRLHFDGDKILLWEASNVTAHLDHKANVFPNKENDQKKIDGIIATISAIGVILNEPEMESPYQDLRPMAYAAFNR